MKNIKLNEQWDLDITAKRLQEVEGSENDKQNLSSILKTFKGSDIFDLDLGINWIPIINYPTKENIKEAIKDGLSQYYKNVIIEDFEIKEDKERRLYYVNLQIKLEGQIEELEFAIGE